VGTWGEGAFDNDTAADWAREFDSADLASGMRLIENALGRAAGTPAGRYLDGEDGDLAVAAAELVAYIADERSKEFPTTQPRWTGLIMSTLRPSCGCWTWPARHWPASPGKTPNWPRSGMVRAILLTSVAGEWRRQDLARN
jgi:hypothetical protein